MNRNSGPALKLTRIAVITDDDPVWFMPFWSSVNSLCSASVKIVCMVKLTPRLAGMKSSRSVVWSLRTFGLKASLLLGIYYVRVFLQNKQNVKSIRTKIPSLKLAKLDKQLVLEFFSKYEFDYVFISTGKIIPASLLLESKKIWLNKHASLLPHYRGIYPFIWAGQNNDRQGYSVHIVNSEIDSGPVVFQKEISGCKSMVHFYETVYESLVMYFPNLFESLPLSSPYVSQTKNRANYYSLPTKIEVQKLRKSGLRIITVCDLF